MDNKKTLNQRWAELEGWTYKPDFNWDEGRSEAWLDSAGGLYIVLPDWTEPNRFFADVVPRMKSDPLYYWFRFSDAGDFWNARLISHKTSHPEITADGKTLCEAGLEAAIKAREERNK